MIWDLRALLCLVPLYSLGQNARDCFVELDPFDEIQVPVKIRWHSRRI